MQKYLNSNRREKTGNPKEKQLLYDWPASYQKIIEARR